jgi:Protein of unknown function (DUF3999)
MIAALGVSLAALLGAAPAPRVERAIEVDGPGRVVVALDRDIYDTAREDLGDLRVIASVRSGRIVPYVLDRGSERPTRVLPRVVDRGFSRGRSERATLDFGERAWKREIHLQLSGDNFRRRVVVEGSDDGLLWTTLTDGAYVFAVPGPPTARYEAVAIPDNDERYLRVSVLHGADDPERIEIGGAWAWTTARRGGQRATLRPRVSQAEDARRRETLLTLDLGARHQPFLGIVLDVADPRFMRGVVVEARRDPEPVRPGSEPPPVSWASVGEGCIYRYDDRGRRLESLSLDATGRERILRVRIRNGDDVPLRIDGVTVLAPVERILFEASPGEGYRLTYGTPDLGAPAFDLARTVGDLEDWGALARSARLGPPRRISDARGVPWTEAHPVLLWAGLLSAILVLGGLTWRALASSRPAR